MARKKAFPASALPRSWWDALSAFQQHLVCALLLLTVAVVFCGPVLFSGKSLVGGDIVHWRAAAESLLDYRDREGEEPLWSTNVFAGMPGYVISRPPLVPQPDNLIGYVRQWSWPFSHTLVLLFGAYFLIWVLTRNALSAVLAACAYGLTTYLPVILVAGHNSKYVALAYAPWLLLGVAYVFRKPGVLSGLLFAAALAINLRAGHIQITYYIAFVAAVWWATEGVQAVRRRRLKPFLLSTAFIAAGSCLAFLMVAEIYWPAYEYKAYSIRGMASGGGAGGLDWDYAMRWSQGPIELLTLLIADAFGGAGGLYWGSKPFTGGPHYVGGVVLLLAGLSIWRLRSRLVVSLGIAAGFMTLFSLGRHFEALNRLMYNHFPLFDAFRVPETWLIAVALVLAVLAAQGLAYLIRREPSPTAEATKTRALYIACGGAIGIVLLLQVASGSLFSFEKPGEFDQVRSIVARQLQRSTEDPQVIQAAEDVYAEQLLTPRRDTFGRDARRTLVVLMLTALALILYRHGKISAWAMQVCLILLVVVDLSMVARRYLTEDRLVRAQDPARLVQTLDVDRYILEQEGHFRVLSLEGSDQTTLARPSFHHESLGGYTGAKLRLYQDFLEHILLDPSTGMPNENALDMMNARFVMSPVPIPSALEVYAGAESGLRVYENLDVLPRAWLVGTVEVIENPESSWTRLQSADFDPASAAILSSAPETPIVPLDSGSVNVVIPERYGPREISYTVETDQPRLLIISEVFYPAGWHATIEGQEVPILQANYLLRGIVVPPGRSTVDLTFDPVSIVWGKGISGGSTAVAYALMLGLMGMAVYRRRRGLAARGS